jgi:hypothetical protein
MANDDDDSFPPKGSARESGKESGKEHGSDGLLGDAFKKVLTTGITAAFMTEEAIRSRVSELKLPKETLHMLLSGASKSKDDLMNRVSGEVIRIINKIDFVKEASRFVEEHKFKITAEVEVLKKDQSASHSARSTASAPATAQHHPGNQEDV